MNAFRPGSLGMDRMARALARAPYFLLGLVLVSLALLLWQHLGMERVISLPADSPFPPHKYDDRGKGGATVATVARENGDTVMRCRLVHKVAYPDCGLMFDIAKNGHGIDLSHFSTISIDIDYQGPGPRTFRALVVNFEPGLSKTTDLMSGKVHEVENLAISGNEPVVVPLKAFAVARWWAEMRKLPPQRADARLDNVIRVELLTSVGSPEGQHVFRVHGVRFHGKWLTQSELLMGIGLLWIVVAVGYPATTAWLLHEQLDASRANARFLREVNEGLQLETRELANQAYHDPLTNALNRQGLRAELVNNMHLMAHPVTAIMVDIDHFKRINDQHGHQAGDAVLRQFVRVLTGGLRASDRLVRWGGEEFLILCPSTDVTHGARLADKLRQALHRQAWHEEMTVTASFGVAQHRADEDIGQLIKRADAQLYAAKQAGRDRVMAAGLPVTPV